MSNVDRNRGDRALPSKLLVAAVAFVAACEENKCTSRSAAYLAAKTHILTVLDQKTDTVFPKLRASGASSTMMSNCRFSVAGHFDTEDSLGEAIRQAFTMDIEHDRESGTWTASNVLIE